MSPFTKAGIQTLRKGSHLVQWEEFQYKNGTTELKLPSKFCL